MHRMHHTAGQMCWQGVVVTFVESEVSKVVILDDVLVEETVQGTPFGSGECFEVAVRVRFKIAKCSHDFLLISFGETTGGRRMGAVPAGQGSPAWATAKRRWGQRFCRTEVQA